MDFQSLYLRHRSRLRAALSYHGVRAQDLDDVLQEALVAIHRKLPEFAGRSSIETWLLGVCWRTAVAYQRRGYHRREIPHDGIDELWNQPSECQQLDGHALPTLLRQLSDEQRDLLALREVGGLAVSEIAQLTRLSRATVRDRISAGTKLLRGGLELGIRLRVRQRSGAVKVARPAKAARRDREADRHSRLGVRSTIAAAILRRPPDVGDLEHLLQKITRIEQEYPNPFCFVGVLEASSCLERRDERQLAVEILDALGGRLRAAAFVFEDPALLRTAPGILNGCAFLACSTTLLRYFSSVRAAAAWLATHCDTESTQSLTTWISCMRAELDLSAGNTCHLTPQSL